MDIHRTDICIIGSGPGGGSAFHKLATASNRQITLLEAGPDLTHLENAKGYTKTRVPKWQRGSEGNSTFQPSVYENLGGASKFYASALFRFRESDFQEQTYGSLVSPAWPFSYADLEPFYAEAEDLYRVHGCAGEDRTEPSRSKDYPYPEIEHEESVQAFADAMADRDWDPFHTPLGLAKFDYEKRRATTANSNNSCIQPILKETTGRAQVFCEHKVLEIVQVGDRIDHVRVRQPSGTILKVIADTFILAAGAAHSPLLLEQSNVVGSGRHDMLGANYMFHQHTLVPVIDGDLAKIEFAKTLAFNRYYHLNSEDPSGPLGHIQIMGSMTPDQLSGYLGDQATSMVPAKWLEALTKNMILFLVSTEDLPLLENRISRREDGTIGLNYTETLEEQHKALVMQFCHDAKKAMQTIDDLDDEHFLMDISLISAAPPTNFLKKLPFFKNIKLAANAHQCGTLKMGSSPENSLVAPDGHFWGIDNLYVTDASVFPSSAHVNPSLTIIANALRVADGIAKKYAS